MGEVIEFPSNGKVGQGYLALPDGKGPGVIVIQEWWGLVDHIKDLCDRFAGEGFVALAPDLFRGEATTEPSEAEKLMMDLDLEQAAKDLSGAVDLLLEHESIHPSKVGTVGFCMGGALALWLATLKPVSACVDYYGGPFKSQPDYSALSGPVLGHFAEHDDWADADYAESLFEDIRKAGKDGTFYVYEGTEHAFFNDTRTEVFSPSAADTSWERTLTFFRESLS